MGWDIETLRYDVPLRLDSHGGEKERFHDQLHAELRERCREALRPVLSDPRYAEIMLFDITSIIGEDEEAH